MGQHCEEIAIADAPNRLRFNEMTLKVEIDGEPMDMECPEMEWAERFNIEIKGTERQKEAITHSARKNAIAPSNGLSLTRATAILFSMSNSVSSRVAVRPR
ncbi:hypothetical protein [Lyngbya sp. CCY1209]|uniref:hypothetical protein n=1 Tax=Lyngbya sp. CCY1209 TaxID=2886103 RepID=UPI002D20C87E|nr:hypothetical protein [Lyngbya sp. CCY1209]MEB3886126.1 hypothetical protein [Lyngbya sp. CCY1209]